MQDLVGKRVEYPSYTDAWMMGDRYGTIERDDTFAEGRQVITIRMDKSDKLRTAYAEDCKIA